MTTEDVTGAALEEMDVPDCARHILDIGRQQLAARRERERAEKEREAAEERARFETAFAPVRAAVAAVVPEGLLRYVDWQEEDGVDDGTGGHWVHLVVPGCLLVDIKAERLEGPAWKVTTFVPMIWSSGRGEHQPDEVESLPVALALAREGFLAQREHNDTVPL